MHKWIKNEHGMTLIELLAAISLFAIFLSIAANFIMQLGNSEDTSSEHITLTQDTNVLMSELSSQYYEGKNNLCTKIDDERLAIQDYQITNGETPLVINDDGCIVGVNNNQPLHIQLTTATSSGQTLSVETTWENKGDYALDITIDDGSKGGCSEFSNKEDFDNIVRDNQNGYTEYFTNQSYCHYEGNSKFPQGQWGPWNACEDTTVSNGSIWFPQSTSIHKVKITADQDLFADKSFSFEGNADIKIKGNVRFEEQAILKAGSSLETNNLFARKNVTVQENAKLQTNCGARIDGALVVMRRGNLNIGGYFFAEGQTIFQENTDISIGHDAHFKKDLKLTGNAKLNVDGALTTHTNLNLQNSNIVNVGGHANLSEDINMMGNAKLNVDGNAIFNRNVHFQENSQIIVNGDAHFKGNLTPEWGAGKICVKGNATFDKALYSNLTPVETSECFKPAGHHIYIVN